MEKFGFDDKQKNNQKKKSSSSSMSSSDKSSSRNISAPDPPDPKSTDKKSNGLDLSIGQQLHEFRDVLDKKIEIGSSSSDSEMSSPKP